jgi:probable HAF family extracellular repeat protein
MKYTGFSTVRAMCTARQLAFALIVMTAALAPSVAAASGYSVAVFRGNTFNGTSLGMTGDGINASGDIVGEGSFDFKVNGQLEGTFHGILVKAGALVDLTDLDHDANVRFGDGARAVAVNASDLAVGWSYAATSIGGDVFQRPVVWQNGQVRDLGMFPHATTGYDDVEATNLNTGGQIIGFALCNCSLPTIAWTLQGGSVTSLPTLGGLNAEAWGINDAGQIVGAADTATSGITHAALWQSGTVGDLGALPGGKFSEAVSINASGVAVGFSTLAETQGGVTLDFGDRHAVVFQNGTLTDLTPDLPFDVDAFATAINVHGQIVGSRAGRAFIWQNGVGTDLNTLIPPGSGVTLTSANGINDSGQVVATGHPAANRNSTVAVVLTPQ